MTKLFYTSNRNYKSNDFSDLQFTYKIYVYTS